MSATDYMNMLSTIYSQYEGQDMQRLQQEFYGEFLDDEPDQSGAEASHASGSAAQDEEYMSSTDEPWQGSEEEYEGSTVATTITYLSQVTVQQISLSAASMQIDEKILEIPFVEQDDPPDDEEPELPR